MNDLIRNETAHAINGVAGRLFTLRRPPAPWKHGTFANQKWVSESRPVKGYGAGGQMRVKIRFDDDCKNGCNTFAITATVETNESRRVRDIAAGGCLHDEIRVVFPELAHLIRWHLCSTDGPMYYVANTLYHAKQHGPTHAWVYFRGPIDPLRIGGSEEKLIGYVKADEARKCEGVEGYRVEWDLKTAKTANFDHARTSACWPDATDSQLSVSPDELKSVLESRLAGLIESMRSDVEGAGFLWQCPAE